MPDAVSVLCEFCGYDLTGTSPEGVCGECGEAVARSLPEHRTGSPWQTGGGSVCLVRTVLAVFRHPRSVWDRVRIAGPISFGLLAANATLAGLLYGVIADSLLAMPLFAAGVLALSMVEYFGLRFFGKRNGWRVSPAVSMTVVGHAGAGWLVAAIFAGVGFRVGVTMPGGVGVPGFLWSLVGRSTIEWRYLLPMGGFLGGMLVFEMLVYTGVRRCRFANPPTATL